MMNGRFGTPQALIRLASALLIEQNDEWLVGRRYLSVESLQPLLAERGSETAREVAALPAA